MSQISPSTDSRKSISPRFRLVDAIWLLTCVSFLIALFATKWTNSDVIGRLHHKRTKWTDEFVVNSDGSFTKTETGTLGVTKFAGTWQLLENGLYEFKTTELECDESIKKQIFEHDGLPCCHLHCAVDRTGSLIVRDTHNVQMVGRTLCSCGVDWGIYQRNAN